AVNVIDLQSKPDPTKINGVGMDLWLETEAAASQAAEKKTGKKQAGKPRADAVTGVERVVLRQDVDMHLYLDGKSGFLATSKDDKEKKKAAAKDPPKEGGDDAEPPKRDHVHIHTQGPFTYDVETMHAQFDVSQQPSPYPNRVEVHRFSEPDESRSDELDC